MNGGKFQQVALQNKAGNFVKANAETSAAGLAKIVLDDKLRGADPNPAGANAYPIVSLTWILAYPESKTGVKETLRYMLSEKSQGLSDSLGYVLSQSLFDRKHLLLLTQSNKTSIMGNYCSPFFMKKKVQKMLEWFYEESDRGQQNISECKNLYDLVERLQYRLEDMESEHMQLTREIARLQGRLDTLESQLPNED